ncbi:glycosyltransferase family 2 protein [Paenibacillus aquistagni]|uniref:Glycosyltransferase, catalytic subunit of cellulose synthase and poly-beta-1,6-N-acetylglucosamine synthase n=1 Tax=Paenibacillus aquistagni TaxID=1852522 RepID=A0A1X7J2D9_9BACL|nr:glycosyltransferase [Paenibacillus aquistagni]SMG21640.1 Glycosyltransferase, catalytic subunit of cellulose synthase and poly-beta-1,6-N-acetylglucosamine synthase [Paenibacillus aquistagni]
MSTVIHHLMLFFGELIFVYMSFVIIVYSVMLIFALLELRKNYRLNKQRVDENTISAQYARPVSLIVPVHNEEAGVIDSVHSLLNLRYPQTEILIINDGSIDNTVNLVVQQFQMREVERSAQAELTTMPIRAIYQSVIHPQLWLIDKENGGKADALNTGINFSKYPYFCSVDGDSILDEHSLSRVMKPINDSNGKVAAVGGNIRIVNGLEVQFGTVKRTSLSDRALVVMQIIEYLRAFLMGRIALSKWNLILIISGAFSVFSKNLVIEAGGYNRDTIGEDMELVVKLHRLIREQSLKQRIEFVPDPVCWTEAPQTLGILRKQRRRWHQGLIESLWSHKRMTLNPKYGMIGMFSFPYFWLVECIGPLIELGGYIYVIVAFFMGDIYYEFAIMLSLLFILYGSLFSVASILLEAWSLNTYPRRRDVLRMMLLSLTEVVWYKPLTLVWRLEGMIHFLLRRRSWGNMERIGLSKKGLVK